MWLVLIVLCHIAVSSEIDRKNIALQPLLIVFLGNRIALCGGGHGELRAVLNVPAVAL